jgi:hypothetical protein
MSTPGLNTPDRRWQWLWVIPALLVASAIVNLRNPHLTPGLRMVWWVMLALDAGLLVSMLGYPLYANYRERRRRRDSPNGTPKPEGSEW